MRELPILFNTEMVQAILNGRKTCTRRVVKGYIPKEAEFGYTAFTPKGCISCRGTFADGYGEKFFKLPCEPSNILYVRETFIQAAAHTFWYKADDKPWMSKDLLWKPSIHMPKEAARIWLKVTDVRAERLQEITEDGAKEEGANFKNGKNVGLKEKMNRTAIERFAEIWNSTIKKSVLDTYGWKANPWVWVIEFERCEKPPECILEGYDKAPNDGSEKCLGYMYDNSDTLLPMCAECRYQASYESEE